MDYYKVKKQINEQVENQCEEETLAIKEMDNKEKHKILSNLHLQFGHASVDRLERLLASSGNKTTVESSCRKLLVNGKMSSILQNKSKTWIPTSITVQ